VIRAEDIGEKNGGRFGEALEGLLEQGRGLGEAGHLFELRAVLVFGDGGATDEMVSGKDLRDGGIYLGWRGVLAAAPETEKSGASTQGQQQSHSRWNSMPESGAFSKSNNVDEEVLPAREGLDLMVAWFILGA
jgi:hypothetical protein